MSDAPEAAGRGERDEPASGVEPGWLEALHTVGQRSGHEVRNALNGVSVNLEVVRGRAARVDAEGLGRFAETAAQQLEAVTRLTEALLALIRPVPEHADVGVVVAPLVTLLDAVARAEEGAVELRRDGAEPVRTSLPGSRLRLLLAELLLEAQAAGGTLCCEVDSGAVPTVRLRRSGGLPAPSEAVRRYARQSGVDLTHEHEAWTAVLPRPAD